MNINLVPEAWNQFQAQVGGLATPKTEEEYKQIINLMSHLIDTQNISEEPWTALFSYLAVLANTWEVENDADLKNIDATPQSVLSYLMEEQGITQQQLSEEGIVDQGNLSKILKGSRGISKALAKKLAQRFQVNIEVFL